MFWFVQTPFLITFALVLTALVIVPLGARKRGKSARLAFWVTMLLSFMLFVPSCYLVMKAIDPFRFGEFKYPDKQSMGIDLPRYFIPDTATEISITSNRTGFFAKYKIDIEDMKKWSDNFYEQNKDIYLKSSSTEPEKPETEMMNFNNLFQKLGWVAPQDVFGVVSIYDGTGSRGFVLWYSPSERMAYERATYW